LAAFLPNHHIQAFMHLFPDVFKVVLLYKK